MSTMTVPSDLTRELDRVLRPLHGHGLYRNNAFRVTALPTDAPPRRVRRHQEELLNPYYVPPVVDTEAPLPPSDDRDALRAAFEVLRDPLARLVHELFWLRRDPQGEHDRAVIAHCRALEATDRDGRVGDAATWLTWREALQQLAQTFAAEETWELARRRAAEIDDPRLSVAMLRALRERLPEHVVAVSVGLAVRAAPASRAQAEEHMAGLHRAGFEARQVRAVARAALEPATDRVREACETAQDADPASGLSAAQDLLDATSTALPTVTAVLGDDDDLAGACRDQVALTVNNRVIAYVNDGLEAARRPGDLRAQTALHLLRRARALAVTDATVELTEQNVADLEGLVAHLQAGGRLPASGSPRGEPGCAVLVVLFLVGAALSVWLLAGQLDTGPLWSVVGGLVGGLMLVGLVGPLFER